MTSLLISREGRLLRLTLAREEKRNALNAELCQAIVEACETDDPSVGAILLDAQGKVFCAGMDLSEIKTIDPSDWHERLFTLGARLRKPFVVAVSGPAIAGGLGLVANAHLAIAAQGSSSASPKSGSACGPSSSTARSSMPWGRAAPSNSHSRAASSE